MSKSKETTNGASNPNRKDNYDAWAAALEPRDRSLEIGCHLGNARAIADLVYTVCGSSTDGSDSRIDELMTATLNNAMHCIMQQVEAADELIHESYACEGGKATASAGH
jgi:hypothetical protein